MEFLEIDEILIDDSSEPTRQEFLDAYGDLWGFYGDNHQSGMTWITINLGNLLNFGHHQSGNGIRFG